MGLGNVDNGTAHTSDEDHAAGGLALHQVLGDSDGEEIGTVNVDAPQLAHAVDRVVDGVVVLGETSAGDEVVDLSMRLDDIFNTALDRVGV